MRGIRESVETSAGNVFHVQTDKLGRTYYRKNGKFVSKRAYTAAKASQNSTVKAGGLGRIGEIKRGFEIETGVEPGERIPFPPMSSFWYPRSTTPNTVEGRKAANDFGRVGTLGPFILPQYDVGDLVENERDRQILVQDGIFQRSFLGFWDHPVNEALSREEAEERFLDMINRMRGVRSQMEQNEIRAEFGIGPYAVWR